VRFTKRGGGMEQNCAHEKTDWHYWKTACDCSGCLHPALGSHGVSGHLYSVD
jgi:hypothetical protein